MKTCNKINMRAFIAIDLDENLRKTVRNVEKDIENLGADMKLVEPENLHITLKFLGEVNEDQVKDIVKIVSDSLKAVRSFPISFQGLNYFGNASYIRTVWIDMKEGKEDMKELIHLMNKNLDHVKHEKNEPSAHLTIGRVRSGRNRDALMRNIQEMSHVKFGEMEVKLVKLKESVLTKKGPIYKDIETFRLE
jgi:2'-5' RNA ligase